VFDVVSDIEFIIYNPGQEVAELYREDEVKRVFIAVETAATDREEVYECFMDAKNIFSTSQSSHEQDNNKREPSSLSSLDTTPCDQSKAHLVGLTPEGEHYSDENRRDSMKHLGDIPALQRHSVYWQLQAQGLHDAIKQSNFEAFYTRAKAIPHIEKYAETELKNLENSLFAFKSNIDQEDDLAEAPEEEDIDDDDREIYSKLGRETYYRWLAKTKKPLISEKKALISEKRARISENEALISENEALINKNNSLIISDLVKDVAFKAYIVEEWVRALAGLNQADTIATHQTDTTATQQKGKSQGNLKPAYPDATSSRLSSEGGESLLVTDQVNLSGGSMVRVFGEHDRVPKAINSSEKIDKEMQTNHETQCYSFARVVPELDFVLSELFKNAKIISDGIFAENVLRDHCENKDSFYPKDTTVLKNISDAYDEAIDRYVTSDPLHRGKKGSGDLLKWFTVAVSGKKDDAESLVNFPPYFPGPAVPEKEGVQRVLPHLLLLLGGQLKNNRSFTRSSPPKSNVRHEGRFEGMENRKERVVDAVVSVRGAHHAKIIRDDALEVMIELKPGQRSNEGPIRLMNQQREQLMGNLGKQTGRGLHFGEGIGVPTFVTGIIAGLGHVQILQLHLLAPGTLDSKLELRATRLLPLMTEKNFEQWYKSDGNHMYGDQWEKLRCLLYPKKLASDGNEEQVGNSVFDNILLKHTHGYHVDKDNIPLGWKAIWTVMTGSHTDLFGAWGTKKIGQMIGFGAYASVFHKYNCNWVTKVSTRGNSHHIQNEIRLLSFLKTTNQSGYPATVVKYENSGLHDFWMGGVKISLPYIITSPQGVSLYYELLKLDCKEKYWDLIKNICEGMKAALKFIHRRNICHNDISDKNIVLKDQKPVLVDFGNAASVGDKKEGFHGTTEFAHREIHTSKFWYCQEDYDWTSLGFTMATILNDGMVVWKGLSSGPVTESSTVFADRIKCAKDIVTNKTSSYGIESEFQEILNWICFDLKKYQ